MLHIVQSNITLVAYMGALSLMNAENLNKHKPHFPFEGALLMGTLLRDYSSYVYYRSVGQYALGLTL